MNDWQRWAFKNDVWLEIESPEKKEPHPLELSGRWTEQVKCYLCDTYRPIYLINHLSGELEVTHYESEWDFRGWGVSICPKCNEILAGSE